MRRIQIGFFFTVLGFAAVTSHLAEAGVTLHYEGKARDRAAAEKALSLARSEAQSYGWEIKAADIEHASVTRIIQEKEKPYQGPLIGLVIYPHPMCEPLYLQFGSDLFLQDYVKTQFAGADVHIRIVDLFRKLRPFFEDLNIDDEGEYWDTNDRVKLEKHIATINAVIDELRKSRPGARGPIKMQGGRMIDIMQ